MLVFDQVEIGDRLRALRKQAGLTQMELAELPTLPIGHMLILRVAVPLCAWIRCLRFVIH